MSIRKMSKKLLPILLISVLIASVLTAYSLYVSQPLGDPGFYEFPNIPPRRVDFVKQIFNKQSIELTPATIEPEINAKYSQDFVDRNLDLLDCCYAYFDVYVGDNKLSPLLPLALSNVEHPDWADPNVTFSSLFPSSCVDCLIKDYSVLTLFSSKEAYDMLAVEGPRGSLSMSTGIGAVGLNLPSELDIIHNAYPNGGYPKWVEEWWLRGVSKESGDRFSVEGSVSRLSNFCNQASTISLKDYEVTSEVQAIALLSMLLADPQVNIDLAMQYASDLTSVSSLAVIRRHANSTYPETSITEDVAIQLYEEIGASSSLPEGVRIYPIRILYAYLQVGYFYSGK